MTVSAPPRPPQPRVPADPEALIEEARRRARRRRLWYTASALIAAAGSLAVFGWGHGGGAHRQTARDESPASGVRTRIASVARPGQLTIIGLPSPNGYAPDGWYDISTLVRGRLHPFIRCEHKAGWCGEVLSVAWAPDGMRLAFSVTSIGATGEFNGIHILNLRTRRDFWKWVPSGGLGDPENLDWSPDGSKLVFDSSGSIYVLTVNGFSVRRLQTGTPDRAFDYSPSWSPDGKRLVFATERHDHSSISVINVGVPGSSRTLLATHASYPSWSPDGKTIAYRTSCGIRLITPRGRNVTPANPPFVCHTIGLAGIPLWSPDGKKIVILGDPRFTFFRPATFVMDRDGRHLRLLTQASGETISALGRASASWQPRPH